MSDEKHLVGDDAHGGRGDLGSSQQGQLSHAGNSGTVYAIERLHPHCPTCSRMPAYPFSGPFRELTFQQKFGAHAINCECGTDYFARFWLFNQHDLQGVPEYLGSITVRGEL